MTTALCPGSFDPPTNGHVDVIERCIAAFDAVVVAVVANPSKDAMFSLEERVAMLEELFEGRASVQPFDGLLVDFAAGAGADLVVKGLRTVDDYTYEMQMAQMNRSLSAMETVFMPTKSEWSFVSSSLIKEVARLGGAVTGLVPPNVAKALEGRV